MARILSSDVLINRVTRVRTTEIIVCDSYQDYAGCGYVDQRMGVRLDANQLEALIRRLNECLDDMHTTDEEDEDA